MNAPGPMVIHADWSVDPRKRWRCGAERSSAGRWRVAAPEPVGDVAAWVGSLCERVGAGASVTLGLDLPIGWPAAYAARAGVAGFLEALPGLGRGRWARFFDVCEEPGEVSPRRPFYPAKPRRPGVKRAQLVDGLGVGSFDELLRRCDRATGDRGAAACLFWTMGAQQVGKAAASGWREVLRPLRERLGEAAKVWPFDGPFAELSRPGRLVIAEAYPRQFYAAMGFPRGGWSKRRPSDRAARHDEMRRWARRGGVTLRKPLRDAGGEGFGAAASGEDAFDAAVGAAGMAAAIAVGGVHEPTDPTVRRVEGWVFGMSER